MPVMSVSPHVLVVDDDVRRVIADYLGEFGLRVSGAADGDAVRGVLAQHVIDLILLDLNLRAEDGMTLARELRGSATVPIIMLTFRIDQVDRIIDVQILRLRRKIETNPRRPQLIRTERGVNCFLDAKVQAIA